MIQKIGTYCYKHRVEEILNLFLSRVILKYKKAKLIQSLCDRNCLKYLNYISITIVFLLIFFQKSSVILWSTIFKYAFIILYIAHCYFFHI